MFTLGTFTALLVLIIIVGIAGGFAYLMDKATVESIKNKKKNTTLSHKLRI